jgi:hypothetical protein
VHGELACTPNSGARNHRAEEARFLHVSCELEYYYYVCGPPRHPSRESFSRSRAPITNTLGRAYVSCGHNDFVIASISPPLPVPKGGRGI